LPAAAASLGRLLEAGAGHLAAATAAFREQCRWAAVQARELAAFATQRPAAVLDRPAQEVGAAAAASRAARPAALTSVSEWAVDEVMLALGLSAPAAARLLADSVTLVQQLPATLAAVEAGRLSWAHARMLAEVLAPLTDQDRAEVEARLLARAPGTTVTQLKIAARRAVLRADASAAARRLAAAIRDRQVRVFPGEDGMATLAATLPTPVALACRSTLAGYADACATPGDQRSRDQRMVDCLAALILRPADTGRPPVQAQLTVVASVATLRGGDEPGEVDGQPVPAALVRELAHGLGLLPRPEELEPDTAEPEPDTAEPAATQARTTPLTPNEAAAVRLAELLNIRTTAGTALAQLPAIAVVQEISGQLLALTNAAELRRRVSSGAGLGPPPAGPGYRRPAALDRFVRARDRRCRFPGCRAPAVRCDLDHNQPWPAGPTSADNLCCLCRHHHRLSHQAPGWQLRRLTDGGLEWTTPGGDRITTHPPRYGTDDDLPPPARPDRTAGSPDRRRTRARPAPAGGDQR
jgi:hypothetical protein